jgi:hypothetical protein
MLWAYYGQSLFLLEPGYRAISGIRIQLFIKTMKEKKVIPSQYKLLTNYPNPFNPSTTISYAISKTGYVTLRIYDIKGVLISELVNKLHTPGTYKVNFENKGLASGVYLYQLKAGDYKETEKMIMLR